MHEIKLEGETYYVWFHHQRKHKAPAGTWNRRKKEGTICVILDAEKAKEVSAIEDKRTPEFEKALFDAAKAVGKVDCSREDNYDKAEGRKKALAPAIRQLFPNYEQRGTKRFEFWSECFRLGLARAK